MGKLVRWITWVTLDNMHEARWITWVTLDNMHEAPAVSRVDTEFLFDDIDEEIVLRHLQWQKGYRC